MQRAELSVRLAALVASGGLPPALALPPVPAFRGGRAVHLIPLLVIRDVADDGLLLGPVVGVDRLGR